MIFIDPIWENIRTPILAGILVGIPQDLDTLTYIYTYFKSGKAKENGVKEQERFRSRSFVYLFTGGGNGAAPAHLNYHKFA